MQEFASVPFFRALQCTPNFQGLSSLFQRLRDDLDVLTRNLFIALRTFIPDLACEVLYIISWH